MIDVYEGKLAVRIDRETKMESGARMAVTMAVIFIIFTAIAIIVLKISIRLGIWS